MMLCIRSVCTHPHCACTDFVLNFDALPSLLQRTQEDVPAVTVAVEGCAEPGHEGGTEC